MHIAMVTAGGAGMFCGSCMHDNTWARALMAAGHEVSLIPTYTPIRVDEADASNQQVLFGGINVYLASKWSWWRGVPGFLKRWLDRPSIIRMATSGTVSNDAKHLGEITLDMLAGESGPQHEQVEELARFIERLRPDVVVFSNALLAGAVRRLKQLFAGPVVCVLQGDDIFLDGLPDSHRERVRTSLSDRARNFDAFITHSHYYSDHMSALLNLPLDRIDRLPLGIDLTGHDGVPRAASDSFTIGYFARICPEKGLHLLVEAFARLHAKHPRTRLRVGGYLGTRDQRYFDDVRRQADSLKDSFEYIGSPESHSEKVAFLKSLDVFSVPTVYREPKGLSVLEAMANGVAVVQPRHGAFPELIRDNIDGLLFEPLQVESLAGRLEELLVDDRRRQQLATTGQQRVRQEFSAEALARESVVLFQRTSVTRRLNVVGH